MEKQEKNVNKKWFNTTVVQLAMIIGLVLLLMIPLEFVKHLIKEREHRKKEVIHEVSNKWGGKVLVYGPIIKVPYNVYTTSKKKTPEGDIIEEEKLTVKTAYFLPDNLNVDGDVEAKNLHRGIYEAVVFKSDLKFNGDFIQPDLSKQKIKAQDLVWDEAKVLIKTTNLKSIRDEVKIKIGNKTVAFEPIYENSYNGLESLESEIVNLKDIMNKKNKVNFNMNLSYNGSESISMVPIGKTSTFNVKSNWADPSFTGSFLPIDKSITDNGFDADWKILHINRAFSQKFFGSLPNLKSHSFGVNFIVTVDQYQQNERASKYGILVLGLTFLTFFMIQIINNLKIHIVEYSMIGLAMVLFYTLLLSITEHTSFTTAYLVAASAVILLISLYSVSLLKYRKLLLFVSGALLLLYSYIYVIIQMENYALLSGSIGLFIILSIVMYFSRKIDWQK